MNQSYPIYTVNAQCQDCFKCVRSCPVKAIKVQDSNASVMPELCVACGRCVEECPARAKKIRDDLGRTKQILQRDLPVFVSLAPSWVSEFRGVPAAKMIASLRKLGFAGVSETALGAELVTAEVAKMLQQESRKDKLIISSACPVSVDFIRKYLPEFADSISPLLSPALSHAKMLHQSQPAEIKVVFIGPCIAKKVEADNHPNLIATAILFSDLRHWFTENGIDPWQVETTPSDVFVLNSATNGALYPIEGGMNETIRALEQNHDITENKTNFVTISGLRSLKQALKGFTPREVKEPVFLETLACCGGCVHGPGTSHASPGLLERLRIIRNANLSEPSQENSDIDIVQKYDKAPVELEQINMQQIRQMLRQVGKTRPEDELNCGGCGYDSCRNFAVALINEKAEPGMCVSYLRQLAQKKSNAMLRCVPAAVVIVDRNLQLIECNKKFAELAGDEAMTIYEAIPGMAGSLLEKLIPFSPLFQEALQTGKETEHDMLRFGDKLLRIQFFNIDPHQVIGAILFDVTNTEFRREQIASQAREVIRKNLSTVQDIACMLGEHMAETEILLRSIAEDYSD
ncbi:MAG: [Fe-Fe] hydrogenase large subunit C-terminal domain-containing protein [Thermoguttaceae bacterium]